MCADLRAQQTLATTDAAALRRYVNLFARAERLEVAMVGAAAFFDKVSVDGAGVEHVELKVHPGFAQLRQYDMALRSYLVEFGQTPAARARVKVPEKSAEVDPFDKFDKAVH